ncbi:MAG: hypothetical protein NVSMB48_13220 [Marmoricola sp.]
MFAADLLSTHASAERATLPERALLLAALACGQEIDDTEPIGRTLARILPLHREFAGPDLVGTVVCPDCGATAEFALPIDALVALGTHIDANAYSSATWRPVSYSDLVAAAKAPSAEAAVAAVLDRCAPGNPQLEGEERRALVEMLSTADPLAEVEATLQCPECDRELNAAVEIADFVWSTVDAEATRLMIEVDALARRYAWSEADIVRMPASRRSRYLALAIGGA